MSLRLEDQLGQILRSFSTCLFGITFEQMCVC